MKTEDILKVVELIHAIKKKKKQKEIHTYKKGDFLIVRTENAGVFFGYFENKNKNEVILTKARRVWYWDGAASLSQMAEEGVSKPDNCKFPTPVSEVLLLGVIEILRVTPAAKKNLENTPIWAK